MKITRIIVTALILPGCFNLHGMEKKDQQLTPQKEAQLRKQKEFQSMLESAKKLGKWRAEAYAAKMSIQSQDAIEITTQEVVIIPTRIAAQCAQITKYDDYTDDNDAKPAQDDDDPFVQYINGKRDDLEAILDAADKEDRKSRSRSVKNNAAVKSEEDHETYYDDQ